MNIPTEVTWLIRWIWRETYFYHNDPEYSTTTDEQYDAAVRALKVVADKHPEWVDDTWPIFNNLTPPATDPFWDTLGIFTEGAPND